MSALQQDQVGTAVLAHRAAQWGSSLQFLSQQTGKKGYRLTIAVAGLRLGLLEISTIFVPFRKSRTTKLKSLPAFHSQGTSLPSPPLGFYTKVECSLCHVCRGRDRTWGQFSFFLLPPQSAKRMHSCKEHRHTGAFDSSLPSLLFSFKTLQDGFISALGN